MLGKLKQTIKQTLIYSLGNISSKLIGFILLPLYTGYLSTEEYGIFAILEITSTIMVAVFSFRLSTAMMRWCSNLESDQKSKAILFTTYSLTLVVLVFLNVILQPFTVNFSNLFFGKPNFSNYFLVLFISASFEILNLYSYDLLRLKEKPVFFVSTSLIRISTILVLNVYLIKYQGIGVLGIILSQLIGNVLVTLVTLPLLINNMVAKFLVEEVKPMLKYGIPLVFSTISMMLLTMGDRYIIKYYMDYSQVGIYSIGYKLASVMNVLVIQSFQTGFLPIAYKNYDKPDAQRFFSKVLTYYSLILVFSALVLSLFSYEILEFLSKSQEYNEAYKIIPLISMAFIFKGVQYVYSLGLHFVKRTKYNATIVLFAAILNFSLNLILIPLLGIYGAAIATVISWIVMSTAFYKYSYKFYKVKYEIGKFILLVFLAALIYLISLTFNDFSLTSKLILKMLLMLILPIVLYVLGFFEAIEIQRMKEQLKRFLPKSLK